MQQENTSEFWVKAQRATAKVEQGLTVFSVILLAFLIICGILIANFQTNKGKRDLSALSHADQKELKIQNYKWEHNNYVYTQLFWSFKRVQETRFEAKVAKNNNRPAQQTRIEKEMAMHLKKMAEANKKIKAILEKAPHAGYAWHVFHFLGFES